jgi:hypothetical protein
MWAHGTEPPRCLAARTGPSVGNCGAERPVSWSQRYARGQRHHALRRGRRSACMVASMVMSQQAMARTVMSDGLPRWPRLAAAQAHGPAARPGVVLNEQVRSGGAPAS